MLKASTDLMVGVAGSNLSVRKHLVYHQSGKLSPQGGGRVFEFAVVNAGLRGNSTRRLGKTCAKAANWSACLRYISTLLSLC